jgi:phosphate-selective porin OprO/OprP
MLTHTVSFSTTVLIALALTAVPCLAGETTNADTLAELAHLRAVVNRQQQQINRLLAQSNTQWLAERRTQQVQDIVRALLADADNRASLLQSDVTAGYGKHFFIASEDAAFLLNTSIKLQLRYIYNIATEDDVITENDTGDEQLQRIDDDEFGFEFRRTEIAFSGHVFDPRLTYKVKLQASRSSGTVSADDIYIGYKLSDDWRLRLGQFKVPFLREFQVSSGRQQAVERSYVNHVFNINRSQGVMLSFRQPNLQADLMIHDGAASKNRNFASDRTNIALAARGQWLLAGKWKQFKDYAAWDGEPLGVMLGGALDWENGEDGSGVDQPDALSYTFDLSIEVRRFNVLLACIAQHVFDNDSPAIPEPDQRGFVAQVGVFVVPDKIDLIARYEHVDLDGFFYNLRDGEFDQVEDDSIELLTFGGNYYFKKHNAKLTIDVVWVMDPLPTNATGLGLLKSSNDDQVSVRTQFQLYF